MKSSVLQRTEVMVLILALLLAVFGSAPPLRAMPADPADSSPVETRFEGFIKAIGPGKWLIGSQSVLVDSATLLAEKRGEAEVGAWVIVWCTLLDNGSIHADLIFVDRPAGLGGPIYQFSGVITKQISRLPEAPDTWIIDDLLVKITLQTQLSGSPTVGWLVWVVAEDEGNGELRGIAVEAIAGSPEDLPVEFEGQIGSIADDLWRVNGHEVFISANTLIMGTPVVDAFAEVKATRDALGRLHAHMIRVLAPMAQAANVAPEMIPETKTAAEPADTVTSPWSQPVVIVSGLSDAAKPALAYDMDGVAHALWQVQGQIYYATQAPDTTWSVPKRIATGAAPTLLADQAGQIHALFHNEFFGNYDIYHMTLKDGMWSLPINIARTGGASLNPALAIDAAGILRASWMDDTPGYWTIYTGYYDGTFWRNYPAPNGRGQDADIATAPDGTLYLAWQDRSPIAWDSTGAFNIFVSQLKNGAWLLPVNVSVQQGIDATNVSVTTTSDNVAHLTWIAGNRTIMYGKGRDLIWTAPAVIIQASKTVHAPSIIAEEGKNLHVAWDEGDVVRSAVPQPELPTWSKPDVVTFTEGQLKDVAITETKGDGIVIGWVNRTLSNDTGVYASAQLPSRPSLPARVWLPLIARP